MARLNNKPVHSLKIFEFFVPIGREFVQLRRSEFTKLQGFYLWSTCEEFKAGDFDVLADLPIVNLGMAGASLDLMPTMDTVKRLDVVSPDSFFLNGGHLDFSTIGRTFPKLVILGLPKEWINAHRNALSVIKPDIKIVPSNMSAEMMAEIDALQQSHDDIVITPKAIK